jgi:hypothetical protein
MAESGSQLGGKSFADDEKVETDVRKWLRLQASAQWYIDGASVSVLVENMLRNKFFFFPRFEYQMFAFCVNS